MGKKRFKNPMTAIGNRLVNLARFESLIKEQPSGCHEWQGPVNNAGYGMVGFYDAVEDKNKMMTAHRLALMFKLDREITPGMNANHFVCHNRICCNQAHLEEGTQEEKIQAMNIAGLLNNNGRGIRGSYNHKQHNRQYKYTEQEIQWIRNANTLDIAAKYNTSRKRAGAMRLIMRTHYRWLPWKK